MNEKLVLALPGLNGLSEQGDEKKFQNRMIFLNLL